MYKNSLIVAALLAFSCLGKAQSVAVAAPGLMTEGGPTIGGVPTPDFSWNFNDLSGTTVTAQTGGQNGTINGTENQAWFWVNDAGNGSVDFEFDDATAADVSVGTILDDFGEASQATIVFWANVESVGGAGTRRIFDKTGTANFDWQIGAFTGDKWRVVFKNAADTGTESWVTDGSEFTTGTWSCHGVVFDAPDLDCSQCVQWYDSAGSAVTTTLESGSTGARLAVTGTTMRMGSNGAAAAIYDGIIDGVKVWTSTGLTGAQIASVCGEGRP